MRKLFVVVILATCGIASMCFAGGQREKSAATKSKIVFYAPTWGEEYAKQVFKLYMAEKPNVEIENIGGPSVWQDHLTRTQLWMSTKYAGVDIQYQDDVFTLDGASQGVWEELGQHMTQAQKDDLVDVQKEYARLHGGIYRIPWWQGMSYNYYRKDILKREGLAVPQTWAELLSTGQKLTRDLNGDGTIDQWGYTTQGYPTEMKINFLEFLWQNGGDDWTLFTGGQPDPKAKGALEYMVELFRKTTSTDWPAIHYNESRALLREGRAVIERDWADPGRMIAAEGLSDVIGVMNFPAGPAGPWGTAGCWGIVVNKYGANFKKDKDVVIDFALYFMRPEIHKIVAVIDAPALKSVWKDTAYLERELYPKNVAARHAAEFLPWRHVRKLPAGRGAEYGEEYGKLIIKCVSGEVDVPTTLKNIQQLINPWIK